MNPVSFSLLYISPDDIDGDDDNDIEISKYQINQRLNLGKSVNNHNKHYVQYTDLFFRYFTYLKACRVIWSRFYVSSKKTTLTSSILTVNRHNVIKSNKC